MRESQAPAWQEHHPKAKRAHELESQTFHGD
jgi:hypothetical protein